MHRSAITTQVVAALVVGCVLVSCATPTAVHNSSLARRPDGTLFESDAELMQYLAEPPEEKARIDAQTRMSPEPPAGPSALETAAGLLLLPLVLPILTLGRRPSPSVHCWSYTYKDQYHGKCR
jgi:hypothetical protein